MGASFLCAFTYSSDRVIGRPRLMSSSMPTAVQGIPIFVLPGVDLMQARIKAGWPLAGAELAVALALTLAPCCIPGAGLMETFPNAVMMPHHAARADPAWQAEGVVDMAPPVMLTDIPCDESSVPSDEVLEYDLDERRFEVASA